MKRISILALIVTGLTMATISSCSKDESSTTTTTTTDARDLSVGTYIGTYTIVFDGQTITDSSGFVISKGPNNTISINDGGIDIASSPIITAGTSFKASIPSQTIKIIEDDSTETSFGVIGNGTDHISFESNSKSCTYSFKFIGDQLDGMIVTTTGVKQ